MSAATAVPATERQVDYILDLLDTHEVTIKEPGVTVDDLKERARGLDKPSASRWIEKLKAAPRKANSQPTSGDWPDVPAGRYAVEHEGTLKFYRVDRPTDGRWAGYTFLSVQASDELYPIKNPDAKRAILALIAEDPKAASQRYGHELGQCGICGRTLTNEESRALGIGPVCAGKHGWV